MPNTCDRTQKKNEMERKLRKRSLEKYLEKIKINLGKKTIIEGRSYNIKNEERIMHARISTSIFKY